MTRSSRSLMVTAVALGMAGVASLGVYRIAAALPARQQVTVTHTVVAARALPLGTRLAKQDVKLVGWPAESAVPGSFATVAGVLDRGVITAVAENQPLTESNLAPLASGAGLPPSIPEGMRAISVKVNEVVGVAGFVVPGTRVDVMVTLRGQRTDEGSLARIVVSNVQVLTAGTRYDQEKAKAGEPIPSTVVTLLVTPADGERVALAAAEGQIMLTLRNPLDVQAADTDGVRTAGLFGLPAPAAVRLPMAARPRVVPVFSAPVREIEPYTVETIRAAKRTQEVVR